MQHLTDKETELCNVLVEDFISFGYSNCIKEHLFTEPVINKLAVNMLKTATKSDYLLRFDSSVYSLITKLQEPIQ
jgi:hypothetical protein